MKVPLSWLRDYVDIKIPPEALAERLTFAGLEVEQIEYLGLPRPKKSVPGIPSDAVQAPQATGERPELAWDGDKLVVGKIVKVEPHPNADRLTLATVDIGRELPVQVVTGAPNIKVGDNGQRVAFALEGTTLFDGHKDGWNLMTLKRAKIRGIESGSMVCSEKELGLSDDHEGIILLPDDAPIGKPLADYLGDIVFEIKINPNMARCSSIIGIAREVAALVSEKLKMPSFDVVAKGLSIKGEVDIRILEPELNPRFTLALVRGITIKPSPFWMQRRLKLCGMRPINNIVDVTNYVMLEIGQPLHAFDYDTLFERAGKRSPTIITRLADAGEVLETLDGVKRKLDPFTILVCDTKGALSIGGIMGGAESEVSDKTTSVLLEAAAWNYLNIRRSMTAQHLASEAGTRFGRGVHPSQAILGLERAIEMMREVGGGLVAKGVVDLYPHKPKAININLPIKEVKRQLGIEIPEKQIVKYLQALEFQIKSAKPNSRGKSSRPSHRIAPLSQSASIQVTVPEHRLDVDGTDDLIEEIARMYGYDRLPISRMNDELPPQRANVDLEQEELVRDLLIDAGLQETITYRFTTPEREALLTLPGSARPAIPAREYVRIENPISADRAALRQTLLPNLLEIASSNLRYRGRVAIFELGPVFWQPGSGDELLARETRTLIPEDAGMRLPLERRRLAIILTGPREDLHWDKADLTPMDFYDLKGIVEAVLGGLHLDAAFTPSDHPALHPRRAASLVHDGHELGVLGELHPLLLEKFDLPAQAILVAELDVDALLAPVSTLYKVSGLSKYPAVVQDVAIVVDESIAAERVRTLIENTAGTLVQRAVLFDVYHGDQIPRGKKSLAYQITFQAGDRTLSDADATKVRERIVARLRNEIGAELRGGT